MEPHATHCYVTLRVHNYWSWNKLSILLKSDNIYPTQLNPGIYKKPTALQTYNFLLLAEKGMALKSLVELTLWNICKDLILSFICCAVWDSVLKEREREMRENRILLQCSSSINSHDIQSVTKTLHISAKHINKAISSPYQVLKIGK